MNYLKRLFSFVVFAFVASAGLALAQVATVFEMTGTATASAAVAPGAPAAVGRALRKGDAVNQGESVTTGANSSIVLRFVDDQVVALAANSTFTINNYTYNQADPAKSNVLISLVNGGMRALSGLIAKARPQAVAYRAGNATIGIRGTDFLVVMDGKNVVVSVVGGSISFTLGGQTVTIPAGRGTYVDLSKPNAPVVVVSREDLNKAQQQARVQQNSALDQWNDDAFNKLLDLDIALAINRGTQPPPVRGATANQATQQSGNAGGQTAGTGGGGSTLPNCSLISPVSAQRPGTNCIQ